MGVYDIIGETGIQVKITEYPCLKIYNVGDEIDVPDGLYFGYEGWFVVQEGRVLCEGTIDSVYDKWGGIYVVDLKDQNPTLFEKTED